MDGRSGPNKRFAHKSRRRDCTTCHQHHIMGAHSKEDGVINLRKVYSTNRRERENEHLG